MISDMFVCLFELIEGGMWTKPSLTLVFWTNLRALFTIRKNLVGNKMKFFWKQRHKKSNYTMELEFDNTQEVVELILDKMEKFGINYKISKQNMGPKTGELPKIDIENVENAISDMEKKIGNNIEQAEVEYLMDLYQKAVEYYSASNNPKFEYYKNKIHLSMTRLNDFLDKKSNFI